MSNSIILNNLSKSIRYFGNSFENSSINKLLLKIDKYFVNWSVNSNFAKLFLHPNHYSNFVQSSKFYLFANKVRLYITSNNVKYVKCILNSKSFDLLFLANIGLAKCPFKLIGLFGSSLLITNIIIQLILSGYNENIILKLLLLCGFMILFMIKISFKKAIHSSRSIKIIKKFIYE